MKRDTIIFGVIGIAMTIKTIQLLSELPDSWIHRLVISLLG